MGESIMNSKDNENKDLELLLTFIEKTKNGEYAIIENIPLDDSRLAEQPQTLYSEELYFYSLT